MMRQFLLLLSSLGVLLGCSFANEDGWAAVQVFTKDGQQFFALASADWKISLSGRPESYTWKNVKRVAWGAPLDPAQSERAQQWIKDLGSETYATRENAAVELKQMGVQALPALKRAQHDPDPETAARAKKLYAEATSGPDGANWRVGDEVQLADGTTQSGTLADGVIKLRTRWGDVEFAREWLDQVLGVATPEKLQGVLKAWAARPASAWIKTRVPDALEHLAHRVALEKFNPGRDGLTTEPCRAVTFDLGPDFRTPLEPGAALSDVYLRWGLRVYALGEGKHPVADNSEPLKARSGPLALVSGEEVERDINKAFNPGEVKNPGKGDLKLAFTRSTQEQEHESTLFGGVFALGFYASGKGKGATGVELFDVNGKSLLKVFGEERQNAGERRIEFFGFYADTPIHSVKITRPPDDPEAELRLDDLVFTPVLPAGRDPRLASARLNTGETIIGILGDCAEKDALYLRPQFLPSALPKSAGLLAFAELAEFNPPASALFAPGHKVASAFTGMENPDAEQKTEALLARLSQHPQHAVLLQSGESFPATLLKLEEKQAELLLSAGVKFSLPREALRKVDLRPKRKKEDDPNMPAGNGDANEGEGPLDAAPGTALVVITPEEKTGVEFRDKGAPPGAGAGAVPAAAPPKQDPPKDPAKNNNPAQGLPRMDNADILKVDLLTGELVVDPKDGGGAWPINLSSARFLVFPSNPEASKTVLGARREWTLVLRSGQQFEARPIAVTPTALQAEIAGGAAEFPHGSVHKLERNKKE